MASPVQQLHFLLVPLMSQSHIIPLTDFAKLLARHGVTVTVIITTSLNAIRLKPIVDHAIKANLKIKLIPLRFPSQEVGLPEGTENLDAITSPDLTKPFLEANRLLQEQLENLFGELEPRPSCIVSTNSVPWTQEVARKFNIPRYIFQTISCFSRYCSRKISSTKVHESVASDSEPFLVPDMPLRIEFKRSQLPEAMRIKDSGLKDLSAQMRWVEGSAHGVLVNTFEELEKSYVEEYQKDSKKLWCVGPVSLCNKEMSDQINRGKKASIDEYHCLKWLDLMKPSSVIYACFGSLSHTTSSTKRNWFGLRSIKLALHLDNQRA